MKVFKSEFRLENIHKITGGEIVGEGESAFSNVAELREANEKSICFYENEKYLEDFKGTKAGLIFIPEGLDISGDEGITTTKSRQIYLKVPKPYLSFMTIVTVWLAQDDIKKEKTISPLASIHPSAQIGSGVSIAPFAVIGENAIIGNNTTIGASVSIGNDVQIGKACKIHPLVVIYDGCKLGNSVIIHSGSVIGADGFGYVKLDETQVKIPQVGDVVIEDDVEIGANTCIDRSTIGTTLIKANTKIDNLVQVGHNCTIEEHTILCSQVGLAGNSHIGKAVYLAGQVGVAGHLKIDDNTLVGAQSGVPSSLTTGTYFGYPALPAFEQKKIYASMKDLPAVVRWVKRKMKE